MDYDLAVNKAVEPLGAQQYVPPTIREQLLDKKAALERDVDAVNAALKLMDENPSFEKVHDAISKVRGLR